MKRVILLLVAIIGFSGCLTTCEKTDFAVYNSNQGPGGFQLTVFVADHGFYEIQYGANGFNLGSGTTQQVNDQTIVNVTNGAYDVYLRGNCGGEDWSDWTGPKSILVEGSTSFCDPPGGVNHFQSGLNNSFEWSQSFADFFEVEFGPTGFTLGTGTNASTNWDVYSTSAPTSGVTYDFYVRANCGGASYSDWSGPVSFIGS